MAIDRKAKKPVVDGLKLRFVRFSGDALTQGVVNTRINGPCSNLQCGKDDRGLPENIDGRSAATSP
jgi:hypothetical protein